MSIKNDGHYFCRAGGNRPDGLNEPVTLKAGNGFISGCWLKPVFRAFYQQNAPLIYVTFAVYEGTGSGT
ncbi:hypothetical protein E8M22_24360 [Escherichia coli]|nr:hypothetical protein [Escherichia coli]